MAISENLWNSNTLEKIQGTFRDPLEKKNFKPEDIGQADIFIRELVQNALDAKRLSDPGPVRICIKSVDFGGSQSLRDLYAYLLSPALRGYLVESEDIPTDYNYSFKGILISDYGTKGLGRPRKRFKQARFTWFSKPRQSRHLGLV